MKPVVGVLGPTVAEAKAYCRERGYPLGLACSPRTVRAGALDGAELHGRVIAVGGVELPRYVGVLLERFEVVFGA